VWKKPIAETTGAAKERGEKRVSVKSEKKTPEREERSSPPALLSQDLPGLGKGSNLLASPLRKGSAEKIPERGFFRA